MVGDFKDARDEAVKKAEEAEERLRKATNELLNLRRNAAKILRFMDEVSLMASVSNVTCIQRLKLFLLRFSLQELKQYLVLSSSLQNPNECVISADDVSDRVDEMMENVAQQAAARL